MGTCSEVKRSITTLLKCYRHPYAIWFHMWLQLVSVLHGHHGTVLKHTSSGVINCHIPTLFISLIPFTRSCSLLVVALPLILYPWHSCNIVSSCISLSSCTLIYCGLLLSSKGFSSEFPQSFCKCANVVKNHLNIKLGKMCTSRAIVKKDDAFNGPHKMYSGHHSPEGLLNMSFLIV